MVDIKLELPSSFFEEEIREGYLVTAEMKQLWAVELDLLNELIRVCNKHNITYYADGGTLLGAVRHQGFIPWDDDIDIAMTRENYNKLCSIAEQEFKQPYFFQTEQTDFGTVRGHAQLRNSETTGILKDELGKGYEFNQGIFIDIFPLDVLPKAEEREKFYKKIHALRAKSREERDYKISKGIKSTNKSYQKLETLASSYNGTGSDKIAKVVVIPEDNRFIWNVKDFDDVVEVFFEGFKMTAPAGYANVLRTTYGTWKKVKETGTFHGGLLFDVSKPYTKYLEGC